MMPKRRLGNAFLGGRWYVPDLPKVYFQWKWLCDLVDIGWIIELKGKAHA
jgi:hypothetical protein